MTKTAQINLATLAATSLCVSKEETRYYLNGVCVEIRPRDVLYIATDGHRLFVARDELDADAPDNSLCGEWIIPAAACAWKFPRRATKFNATMTRDESGKLFLDYDGETRGFSPIDGTFPSWRRVLPTQPLCGKEAEVADECHRVTFNFDYLQSFAKIAKQMDLPKPHIVRNGSGPAFIWFGDRSDAFGVIMPFRSSDMRARVAPDWTSGMNEAERLASAETDPAPEPTAENVTPIRAAS